MMKFLRLRSNGVFAARSTERDAESDRTAVKSVAGAINLALDQALTEHTGLKKRLDDVISRAALVGGNDADEYLIRTADRSNMLRNSDADIKRGQDRLLKLEENISHFRFLKGVLESRFSDFNS
jgi:hypothetical protein